MAASNINGDGIEFGIAPEGPRGEVEIQREETVSVEYTDEGAVVRTNPQQMRRVTTTGRHFNANGDSVQISAESLQRFRETMQRLTPTIQEAGHRLREMGNVIGRSGSAMAAAMRQAAEAERRAVRNQLLQPGAVPTLNPAEEIVMNEREGQKRKSAAQLARDLQMGIVAACQQRDHEVVEMRDETGAVVAMHTRSHAQPVEYIFENFSFELQGTHTLQASFRVTFSRNQTDEMSAVRHFEQTLDRLANHYGATVAYDQRNFTMTSMGRMELEFQSSFYLPIEPDERSFLNGDDPASEKPEPKKRRRAIDLS